MTMYLEHFGLNEAPFKITPHTEFFFAGANRGETLEALLYAITSGEGMVKVTGEVGAGKTMLCRVLMERLPASVEMIYLAVPSVSRDEILATIAGDLGIDPQGSTTTKLIRALQTRLIEIHAEGKQVVALIDEAHAMPLETLEEIRLLSNLETSHDKLMQIVLFGQPELDQHLMLPNMRQLKERITHSFNLLPLPPRDIKDYLNFRLRAAGYKGPDLFSADAVKLIGEASEGLTRRINIYADKTLLAAYAAGTHTVTADHVRAAVNDTRIVLPETAQKRSGIWAVVAVVAALAIGFVAGRYTAPDAQPAPQAAAPTSATGKIISIAKQDAGPAVSPAIPDATAQPAAAAAAAPPAPAAAEPASAASPTAPVLTAAKGLSGQETAQSAVASPAPVTATPPPDIKVPPAKPADKDWLETRITADRVRLDALDGGRYTIQLMTADERERGAIADFLRVASKELNPDRIMTYSSGTTENPKVSVVYGNFRERADASAELAQLSRKLAQFRPYVRSLNAVRDDYRPGS